MSVQASPSVKKMVSVFQIALGCDQKKPLIMPVLADTSHRPMISMRMPIWVAAIAQPGQSFCTGGGRADRAGEFTGKSMAPGSVRHGVEFGDVLHGHIRRLSPAGRHRS